MDCKSSEIMFQDCEDSCDEVEINSTVLGVPSCETVVDVASKSRPSTRQGSRIVRESTRDRPKSSSSTLKQSNSSWSLTNSNNVMFTPHKLGQKPKYLNKMRKDPDAELVKNFNLAKNKLDVEKTKYKNVHRNIVKLFNECRGIANKLPDRIVFDEVVDGLPSSDSFNLSTSKQSFEKLKVDYIEVAKCFISDFKKSMQEGGDQVVDFKALENQLLENLEMKIQSVDQNFEQKIQELCKPKTNEAGEIVDKNYIIDNLKREIEMIQDKFHREELKNRELSNKISDNLKHMKVQNKKLEESETKVDELKKTVKERDAEIKDNRQRIKKFMDSEKEMSNLLDELDEVKKNSCQQEEELKIEISNLKDNADQRVQEMRRINADLKSELATKDEELKRICEEKEKLLQNQMYNENEIKSLRNSILNARNTDDEYRENFQLLKNEMLEKSVECSRLKERVCELETEIEDIKEVKSKEISRTTTDIKQHESLLEKYRARECEYQLTIRNLKRNLENELIEKGSKDGLLMLRGALIGALQEKETTYKNRIEHLEMKLAEAHRQNHLLTSKLHELTDHSFDSA